MPEQTTYTQRVIADLPFVAAATHGDRPAWRFLRGTTWCEQSFTEVAEDVRDLALGLVNAGIMPGDRVCVLSETRPEWSRAALAILAAGAVVVPIYPTSSVEECAWVVGNSGAVMVICENAVQLDKISSITEPLPALRAAAVIDPQGTDVPTIGQLAGNGHREPAAAGVLEQRWETTDIDAPAVIIYTSGTTGRPKGCVLTHRNWLTLCRLTEQLSYVVTGDVVYLFLPLAHVFAQIVQFACLYAGATLAYFSGDPDQIVPGPAAVRPTFLPSVPRIFEKVYTLITGEVEPERLAKAVRAGLEVHERKRAGADIAPDLAAAYAEADEQLFGRVRAVFGGRLRQALSGAAPISRDVLEFFLAAGVPCWRGTA